MYKRAPRSTPRTLDIKHGYINHCIEEQKTGAIGLIFIFIVKCPILFDATFRECTQESFLKLLATNTLFIVGITGYSPFVDQDNPTHLWMVNNIKVPSLDVLNLYMVWIVFL